MTKLTDRIRRAAFDEIAKALASTDLKFEHVRPATPFERRFNRTKYAAEIGEGSLLTVHCERDGESRAWFEITDAAGEVEASFMGRPGGPVAGNPLGAGFNERDHVGSAPLQAFAAGVTAKCIEFDGDGDGFVMEAAAPADVWVADFESRNTTCRAFGSTPEQAVAALDGMWRGPYAGLTGADEDYVAENRESISVHPAEIGCAYILGGSDGFWHQGGMNGDDSRFDASFGDGPAPGPR
jgi:hypothetical protein